MITFVTTARVPRENAAAWCAIIEEMIANVAIHEPGVIHYGFGRSSEDPELWAVVEVYWDAAAHAAHWETDYIRPLLARSKPLVIDGSLETKRFEAP